MPDTTLSSSDTLSDTLKDRSKEPLENPESDSSRAQEDPLGLDADWETPGEEFELEEAEDENLDQEDERTEQELANELLALIFASPDPLSTARLAKLLRLKGKRKVLGGLDALAIQLADQKLPLVLRSVSGGWRLFTRPEMSELLSGLTERKPDRISPAALETLSIVAYRQPVSKAEIEAIRGVGSGPILRALVDRRLAKVTGRADQPGSPLLYGTTREFLERFGLDSPADLPRDGELSRD